jgi:hypothetical protein
MLSPRFIGLLRWLAAILAILAMASATFFMYEALFVQSFFGSMAIFSAVALWLAATALWWFVAEAHVSRTRARIRHILVYAIVLAIVAVVFRAFRARRVVDGIEIALAFEAPLAFILGGTLGAFYSLFRLRGTREV